jgi:hypothetical protein
MIYGVGMVLTFIGFILFTLIVYLNDSDHSQKYGTEEPMILASMVLIGYGFIGSIFWPLTLVLVFFNKDKILKSFNETESKARNFAQGKELGERLKREAIEIELKKEIRKEIKDETRKKKISKEKQVPSSLIIPDVELTKVNWDEYNEEFDKAIEYINHKAKNPDNIAWGVKQITRLAEMGMPKAQYKLGMLYLMANGVEKDIDKYFFWMEKCESVYGSATNPKYIK